MAELKIRISKENLKKEADMIKRLTSDEVFEAIKNKSNLQIVKMGLVHFAKTGRLLQEIAARFPRRADQLPKI
jgi:hypothetical protein